MCFMGSVFDGNCPAVVSMVPWCFQNGQLMTTYGNSIAIYNQNGAIMVRVIIWQYITIISQMNDYIYIYIYGMP